MILDGLLSFTAVGTPQAITATAPSANVLDMLAARDMGIGDNPALKLACYVTTTFTSGGAGTLTIQIQGSPDNATWTTLSESRAYALADLVSGNKLFPTDLPAAGRPEDPIPRYYRLNFVNGTAVFTAGAVDAKLVLDRQDNHQYPAGINITN